MTSVDVACLQEMTPGALEWLGAKLGERYSVLSPETRIGRAWPHEGHDVAIVVDRKTCTVKSCKVRDLGSDQQRCVFIAELVCTRSGAELLVATTHLESGLCEPGDL